MSRRRAQANGARPFLKWAGGKARLAPVVVAGAPKGFSRYHEPFVGGGAVFFAMTAARPGLPATLSDSNAELINAYVAVRDHPDALIAVLRPIAEAYRALDSRGRRDFYYAQRACEPSDPVARAARLIFLNKTGYNGLYRVNRSGKFNVPHGRYTDPRILDEPGLRGASVALQGVEVQCTDFADACERALPGDLVYLDPPYHPLSATARFTSYTQDSFGPDEQRRLRDVFDSLTRRGVAAMLSNSDHPVIAELYGGRGYTIERVPMTRAINSKGDRRAPIDELLITNLARAEVRAALEARATS
ncbi:MAG: DNA adenine methylase [Dehalococcoidia bacterium]